jgi:ubiquinone/menaquinone biosynthesis C-methylase UbiE
MIADSSHVQTGRIRSDFVKFTNRDGVKLAACVDYLGEKPEPRPWVVIAPKFGETKKNSLQLAYYLAANGLNVLRFDHTNHVGESGGNPLYFTLGGGAGDILSCADYLAEQHAVKEFTLVANSLSVRTALRAAAREPRIAHVVGLVGVVNLRHTLQEVYRDDLVGGHLAGRRWGVGDMLGVEMDYDHFLQAAVRDDLHDLAGTRADLAQTAAKVSFFAAEQDGWVLLADVREALASRAGARLVTIPEALHELRENPAVAERAFRAIVAACVAHARGGDPESVLLRQPDKRQLLHQNRIERERLRQVSREEENERDFWARYLAKYKLMHTVDDYQAYLRLVGRLLGPIRAGEIVLDAGCGNGMFGIWVIRTLLEQLGPEGEPPVYVGVDLTVEGLRDAVEMHTGYGLGHIRTAGERAQHFLSLLYGQTDLDTWGMPASEVPGLVVFGDNTFDKACCSLVLSYLNRPQGVLAELHRVLRPGARIVVSSMKPFCDLSAIYRDFMGQRVSEQELESGRDLLRAAGKIRLKEEHGFYTFYSAEELTGHLTAAGFRHCAAHLSFGGQAVVVAAEK